MSSNYGRYAEEESKKFGFFLLTSLALGSSFELSSDSSTDASLWLCAATYCAPSSYLSRTYLGPTKGFVPTYTIYDSRSDTNGFIGYLPSLSTIFVVFRGSIFAKNWASDLDACHKNELYIISRVSMSGSKSNPLNSFDSTLQVHKGFYNAEQSVISSVVSQVNSLLKQHPGSNVIVAGHSLGAALAQLTGMDLIKWYFLPCC